MFISESSVLLPVAFSDKVVPIPEPDSSVSMPEPELLLFISKSIPV